MTIDWAEEAIERTFAEYLACVTLDHPHIGKTTMKNPIPVHCPRAIAYTSTLQRYDSPFMETQK